MTETPAAPSKLASVVSRGVSATERTAKKIVAATAPHITWAFDWTTYLLGLQAAWKTLVLLCRNRYSWIILVPVGIAIYGLGHHEEAVKAKAVFNQLSFCVANLNAAKAVKAPSCPAVAPAPAAVAPAPASEDAKAPTPHRKKKASTGSWW